MNKTTLERTSDTELVIKRTFNGRARFVFEALTKPELLKRWWAPKSLGVSLFSCEVDLRVGGAYRYVFGHDAAQPVAFSGVFQLVPSKQVLDGILASGMERGMRETFDQLDALVATLA